jgi:hypothetical protein
MPALFYCQTNQFHRHKIVCSLWCKEPEDFVNSCEPRPSLLALQDNQAQCQFSMKPSTEAKQARDWAQPEAEHGQQS